MTTVADYQTDSVWASQLWERYEMPRHESHFGGLKSEHGYLPMTSMSIEGKIVGLVYRLTLTQRFSGRCDAPIEASYTFPMPAQAGVSRFVMTTQTRKVIGELKERGQARQEYKAAVSQGKQAALTEQERPDVFTMTVGNIPAGEWVEVCLDLEGPLEWCDNHALFRFPLVVGERFTPGSYFLDGKVGTGVAKDTPLTRDASRVSPPRILSGYPNPVELSIDISVEHGSDAWWKELQTPQSSLAELRFSRRATGYQMVLPDTANRIDRDLIVRIPMQAADINTAIVCESDGDSHTLMLNLIPPCGLAESSQGPRQVVVLLDRSGSMQGWKQAAACRAVGQLINSLESDDKFNVLAFDDRVDQIIQGEPLARASALSRHRAQHALAKVASRGGTSMLGPLSRGIEILGSCSNPYLILITDGEVTNEKSILDFMSAGADRVKVFTVGIGTAVNASFLQSLSGHNGGTFTQVESEQSLNQCLRGIRRLIEPPVLQNIHFEKSSTGAGDWEVLDHASVDLFAGGCQRLLAQAKGRLPQSLRVVAEDRQGVKWVRAVPVNCGLSGGMITKIWARQRVLDLEYGNSVGCRGDEFQAPYITAHSLKYGVLSRFTAFLAVDHQSYVDGHRESVAVTQLVSPTDSRQPISSFVGSDPFSSADPFGSSGPFASVGDSFAGSDPFACVPSDQGDLFGGSNEPFSLGAVVNDPFADSDPFASADPFCPASRPGDASDRASASLGSQPNWQPVPSSSSVRCLESDLWAPMEEARGGSGVLVEHTLQQSLSEVDSANSLEALIEAICGLQLQLALAMRGLTAGSRQKELETVLVKLRDLLVLVSKRGDALTLGELSRVRKEVVGALRAPQLAPFAKPITPPTRDEDFWK